MLRPTLLAEKNITIFPSPQIFNALKCKIFKKRNEATWGKFKHFYTSSFAAMHPRYGAYDYHHFAPSTTLPLTANQTKTNFQIPSSVMLSCSKGGKNE